MNWAVQAAPWLCYLIAIIAAEVGKAGQQGDEG